MPNAQCAAATVRANSTLVSPVSADTVVKIYLPLYYAFYMHIGDTYAKRVQYLVRGESTNLPPTCEAEWTFIQNGVPVLVATETSGHLVVDRAAGTIFIGLSETDTAAIAGIGQHHLRITYPHVQTIIEGDLVVTR